MKRNRYIGTVPRLSTRGIDQMYSQASRSTGTTQLGGCTCDQAGGLSLKDIGRGINTAYTWAKKNRPIQKLNQFIDKVVPANFKLNPIYSGIRNATAQLEQAGFGQTGTIMGPIQFPIGRYQPILNAPRKKRQIGSGSKSSGHKKPAQLSQRVLPAPGETRQKGAGKKRKSIKRK